jgi:predicted CxxxxCH...CXXCH cytochrome family protein
VFSDFVKMNTNVPEGFNYQQSLGDFIPYPTFDVTNGSCTNTYCHGYFKNGNTDNVVSFTAGSQGAVCGSCHGDPSTGNPLPRNLNEGGSHPLVQDCSLCHFGVVEVDGSNYTIIDKDKHINGKLNIFGNEEVY